MNNKIVIVLALYKTSLEDCVAYKSLMTVSDAFKCDTQVVIYNNSSEIKIEESDDYLLLNSQKNEMLTGAYNFGLEIAINTLSNWMLLLDQDTEIALEYINEMNSFFNINSDLSDYVAVVPNLLNKDTHLSPIIYSKKKGPFIFFKHINYNLDLPKDYYISAYNSGTLLNVNFIKSIGGFLPKYPLDMLDHWYFLQINLQKKKVYILNTCLQQNLSLLNISEGMGVERYSSYIKSLIQFSKELSKSTIFYLKIKLLYNCLNHLFKKRERRFFKVALKGLFQ